MVTLKEGMKFMSKCKGRPIKGAIKKVGPVTTEHSCWGKYESQMVWVLWTYPNGYTRTDALSYAYVTEMIEKSALS